jgi:hypothetical protein
LVAASLGAANALAAWAWACFLQAWACFLQAWGLQEDILQAALAGSRVAEGAAAAAAAAAAGLVAVVAVALQLPLLQAVQ